jgi:hypothetical protein
MTRSKNLGIYLQAKDKNCVRIGDWATQVQPGVASCKTCVPHSTINFGKGKKELTNHSETLKHQRSAKIKQSKQPDIEEALSAGRNSEMEELVRKTRDLEISLTQFLSRHSIPPRIAECLTEILKKYIPDFEIVQKMKLGREKARYLTDHGISEVYEEETIRKMRNSDAISVALDESEVNKKSELEVMVNISTAESGIERRHYKTIDLDAGDAATITHTLLDALTEDEVDYKAKVVDAGMDGCNTMQGHRTGERVQYDTM